MDLGPHVLTCHDRPMEICFNELGVHSRRLWHRIRSSRHWDRLRWPRLQPEQFRHVSHPQLMKRKEKVVSRNDSQWRKEIEGPHTSTHFACSSSSFQIPISLAFFFEMTPPSFFFSRSFLRIARFLSSSFFARLLRAGFSSNNWRPFTRSLYIRAGSETRERLDAT